jgi:hypothetical protein
VRREKGKIMFKIELELSPEQEELVEIAELVRQACWRAATSERNSVAQQCVPTTSSLVTSVNFKEVLPATAYDATALTLYWLVWQLVQGGYAAKDDADAIMDYIADGITIREALELLGQAKVNS